MENQEPTSDVEAQKKGRPISTQKRRKLVQGAVVAPALLISGRSALAGSTGCALSPMAWMSLHPTQNQDVTLSHTVGCNTLGKSPGYWTPNGTGKTFQPLPNGGAPWASAGLKAFQQLTYEETKGNERGSVIKATKTWSDSEVLAYSGLPYNDANNQDVGWNSGSKLPFGSDFRSISRILIEESASKNTLWHLCAAYLNALSIPGYALTVDEVILLSTGKLTNTGYTLSDSQIKDFLDQTW